MKYLAIASALAVIAFGAASTASALPDMSAARESGAAESLVKITNPPVNHLDRNPARGLYLNSGSTQTPGPDFGIAAQR